MSPFLRSVAPFVLLLTLSACQQAVRPNLDDGSEASTAFPLPEERTEISVLEASSATGLAGTAGLSSGQVVFARINRGLSPKSCAAGSNSDRWRQRYAGNPAAFAGHIENILPLLDFVSVEVERAGLPSEFVFIPLVESWYRPEVIGPGGPAGMWQMISSTARNHGIHIKPGYDGRLSPVESTRAALSYLKTLQDMFDDWQAIVMAYNAGEGRLMRAFRKSNDRTASAAQRKPHGLSNITYDYVAKLQALACLVSEPEEHGLRLPVSTQFVPLAPVLMDARVGTLDRFAADQGKNPELLRRLNPAFKGGRVVAGVPRLVLTPLGSQQSRIDVSTVAMVAAPNVVADEVATGSPDIVATSGNERASTHTVRAGESLWSIAKRYSLSVDQLRRANGIDKSATVRPGQTLQLVP